MRIAVTTSLHPTPAELEAARAAGARWGLPVAARGRRSTAALAAEEQVEGLLVLTRAGSSLVLPPPRPTLSPEGAGERVHPWSPGMGAQRAKRVGRHVAAGRSEVPADRDPFFEAADLRPGDAVLDCTLGLGADALVAAVATGPAGRVVGIEGS
ncbi:MAG TPA: hypothetical protein VLT61_13305, partial [Anaeromyxobacteraceae bacterium]|nr:hypothetical protein [Anaeromyxobacteraceae bacterium]